MKTRILLTTLALTLTGVAQAALYYNGTGSLIPDGGSGISQIISSSGGGTIQNVSAVLNVSGGFNGDYYAYLNYNDGSSSKSQILLNHMGGGSSAASGSGLGTGAATTGYTDLLANGIKLVDGGSGGNIHNAAPGALQYVPVGNYVPDSGGVTFASTFAGMSGNGTWTLYFADTVPGDQGKLVSWGLEVLVPEPVNVALGCFAGLCVVVSLARSQRVRKLLCAGQASLFHRR